MRKLLAIFACLLGFLCTGCSEFDNSRFQWIETIWKSDEQISNELFEEIIYSIQEKDNLSLYKLFAENIKSDMNLDAQISSLLDSWEIEIISWKRVAGTAVKEVSNGNVMEILMSSYILETSDGLYRVAIEFCIRDEFDENNIGLMSIYIIRTNSEYAYWGENNHGTYVALIK